MTLKLRVRRKRGDRKLVCSGCGRKLSAVYDTYEREMRDLPWSEFRTTVVVELYRVRCPDCGVKREKVPQLPSKAPFSKRFEEAVGLACESAAVRRVAKQFGLSPSTMRTIDERYRKRWAASRRKPALRQMGIDEIYLAKKQKFGWHKLTFDQMKAIMNSRIDCTYCRTPFSVANPPTRDRKDSTMGRTCNVIKNSLLTYEEMLYLGPIIRSLVEKGPVRKNTRLTEIP